jgi:hypothetical protein
MQHCNQIAPYLYLGDANFLEDEYNLPEFELVINCCPEIGMRYPTEYVHKVIQLRFADDPEENEKLVSLLQTNQILEQMHHCIQHCKPVLVHCAMGMQRSPAVVACYLLQHYNVDFERVVSFIKSKRPEAFLTGYNFAHAMLHYDRTARVGAYV